MATRTARGAITTISGLREMLREMLRAMVKQDAITDFQQKYAGRSIFSTSR